MRKPKIHRMDDVWVDWLSDEPLPPRPDQQSAPKSEASDSRYSQAARPVADDVNASSGAESAQRSAVSDAAETLPASNDARATTDGDKPEESGGISIQIEMPNISWGRPSWLLTLPSYTRAQIRSAGLACLVALVLGVGLRVGLGMTPYGEKIGLKDHSGGGDSAELARPDYQPVVPGDKSNLATPADGEAGYDDVRDLYSYKDTFANANIVVAQQPLPDDLASDADRLSKVAAAIGADKPFETAFGAAYHSSADEAGDQRVVAVYQDRLLLIQSDKRFDSEDWQYYIESLR